ncbi:ring-cleaving dioxygenase [Chelativorans sp. AA-79]|uniref:ring-cleaving dioxygenase n=1 Tax=Chelativorans sp. AA-79 TaxID=3028735 RepID=UPI0023F664EC|nr:ring-cleaving dioxygenase [Chelativorans sp. AA-79]WEX10048.1 ring-cleaving dioxygenase [Chelativorans sp. AA-79]
MLDTIEGIHHITSMARDAPATDHFHTAVLGLRRVKKTVNFDAPDVYHLYYANRSGQPGTVLTYFPFPNIAPGVRGAGEVGTTVFSVPEGSLGYWEKRLAENAVGGIRRERVFAEDRLLFDGVDGDGFALAAVAGDAREPWTGGGVPAGEAIRGFHSATMLLRDGAPTRELLEMMGFKETGREGNTLRLERAGGNGAVIVDIVTDPAAPPARQGAGSVHHIAFAVPDAAAQRDVREALVNEGFHITPVIDRDYFLSIYFRAPGGVLFEIATDDPGFARDEDLEHLGEALKLPRQHEHLRPYLESHLPAIGG